MGGVCSGSSQEKDTLPLCPAIYPSSSSSHPPPSSSTCPFMKHISPTLLNDSTYHSYVFDDYISNVIITQEDLDIVHYSWHKIITSESYILKEARKTNPYISGITAFYDCFYEYLFK